MTTVNEQEIAIVGAGMAGLACARQLAWNGVNVQVFDKGRSPGGRVATRRVGTLAFDHGAQYATFATDDTKPLIDGALAAQAVAPWSARIVSLANGEYQPVPPDRDRWVGVPSMSALAQSCAAGLSVHQEIEIAGVRRTGQRWRLITRANNVAAEADTVIVAVPAPQAVALLSECPHLAETIATAKYRPCWAVMLAHERRVPALWDGAFVSDGPLSWIARNGSKPGRSDVDAWVLHASAAWSEAHLEAEPNAVVSALRSAFRESVGSTPPRSEYATAHRWRYALCDRPLGQACLYDETLSIGACGDWCLGGKIEAALQSGLAMANRVFEACSVSKPARSCR